MEGVLTEYYLRIRDYSSLERIRNILRYRLKMSTDPDLHFSSFRIRISITVHAQFYINLFINLFSANFYLFFAGFLQEKLRFLQKTRINNFYFYVKTRQELNEWVVRHALSPRAEPLPEYGREGMVAIREFYRKLADDEGTVQFYANHPSKYNSFSVKSYRVSF
jgi:hypothetical protein